MKAFRDNLAIRDRLAKADPGNAGWQRDLSVSYNKVGDALVAQGSLPEALKAFRDSLAIADRLAKADPGNAQWQLDLAIAHDNIGDILSAQGDLSTALINRKQANEIFGTLAASDGGNANWQRELSVSHDKVGDVLVAQGNLPEALKSFQGSLNIADRLAKADPDNAGWLADLAASHGKLGQLYVRMGDKAEARRVFERGRAIVAPFAEKSGHQLWIGYVKSFDAKIAALEASPLEEAQAAVEAAFGVREFAKAAQLQAKLAGEIEKVEREKAGKPGAATASQLLELSWYRLFARDYWGALEASDRAIAIEPDRIIHATNKAHALMFLGRSKAARALYLRYKGQRVAKDGKPWEEAILDDFKEMEARGLKHRQMAEIRALLTRK